MTSIELAWSEATLFKTRPVQTADTTSIIYSTTPIVLHSLHWHRVFFYIKMDGSRNGRGMEAVFFVCFVCDLTAVSQFFFSRTSPSLSYSPPTYAQQYTPPTYVYILRSSRPRILANLITLYVEFPAPLSISSRLKLSPAVSIRYKRILRICCP